MPLKSECFFQAPYEEFITAIEGSEFTMGEIYIKIVLTEKNRHVLIGILANDIHEYIQRAKIEFEGEKLIEAYDGFEFALLSKKFDFKNTVLEKFINEGYCGISKDW
jgi:hypothetical protein